MSTMTTPAGSPAGWYPNPSGAPDQRYFDGQAWTPHVAPRWDDWGAGNVRSAGIFIAATITAVMFSAGIANADDNGYSGPQGDHDADAYWADITGYGATGSIGESATLAENICAKLDGGVSEGQLIAAMSKGNQSKVAAVKQIIDAAEWHYCPEHYDG